MRLLLTLATVLCLFGVLLHADTKVNGTWEWTAVPTEGDQVQGTLEIKDDGGKIAGVLITHDGERINIVNPKLEDNQFSFSVTVGENTYDISVAVDGDKFAGKFKGENASGTIQGSKKA
jgi:hypothetical protein